LSNALWPMHAQFEVAFVSYRRKTARPKTPARPAPAPATREAAPVKVVRGFTPVVLAAVPEILVGVVTVAFWKGATAVVGTIGAQVVQEVAVEV